MSAPVVATGLSNVRVVHDFFTNEEQLAKSEQFHRATQAAVAALATQRQLAETAAAATAATPTPPSASSTTDDVAVMQDLFARSVGVQLTLLDGTVLDLVPVQDSELT